MQRRGARSRRGTCKLVRNAQRFIASDFDKDEPRFTDRGERLARATASALRARHSMPPGGYPPNRYLMNMTNAWPAVNDRARCSRGHWFCATIDVERSFTSLSPSSFLGIRADSARGVSLLGQYAYQSLLTKRDLAKRRAECRGKCFDD